MSDAVDWEAIEREMRAELDGLDGLEVDRARLERAAADVAARRVGLAANRLEHTPEPPRPGDLEDLDALSRAEREELAEAGRAALRRGAVAVAVLNGGMATRFGGGVKGITRAVGARSFLEIKLAQARRFGDVPFLAMNSFATHRATQGFLEARGLADAVGCFLQSVSLRLTPEGLPFRDDSGRISLYAPGHGDFPEALRRSGALAKLLERGARVLLLSNVDNLGADPDPLILGFHLAHGRGMTVETVRSVPGDAGGAPARVKDELQLVEGFRLPEGFAVDRLPYMNTNTFAFSLETLERDWPLTWFYVEKQVDGRTAIQLERLVGELSRFVATAYLGVPRGGPHGRYLPVKTRADLDRLRADPDLERRFSAERDDR